MDTVNTTPYRWLQTKKTVLTSHIDKATRHECLGPLSKGHILIVIGANKNPVMTTLHVPLILSGAEKISLLHFFDAAF